MHLIFVYFIACILIVKASSILCLFLAITIGLGIADFYCIEKRLYHLFTLLCFIFFEIFPLKYPTEKMTHHFALKLHLCGI